MREILVTAKVNPDLDGTSCLLAYADLLNQVGKKASGIVTGSPQSEVQYFIKTLGIEIPLRNDASSGEWSEFVLVDASSMMGMPKVVDPHKVIEIIDHRVSEPEKEFPNARIQNELIGAAATIVIERFVKAKKKIKFAHAKLLYGAIFHNTLNFIATNAGTRDKNAVKYLEDEFGLGQSMIREMFDFSTQEVLKDVFGALKMDKIDAVSGNNTAGAYQLIVWGNEILDQRKNIESAVERLEGEFDISWSFINIVDLAAKRSHLFVSSRIGQEILSKAFQVKFDKGWAEIPAILRKQIMPKVGAIAS